MAFTERTRNFRSALSFIAIMSLFVPISDHQITAQIFCLYFAGKDCSVCVLCWVPGSACVTLHKAPSTCQRNSRERSQPL